MSLFRDSPEKFDRSVVVLDSPGIRPRDALNCGLNEMAKDTRTAIYEELIAGVWVFLKPEILSEYAEEDIPSEARGGQVTSGRAPWCILTDHSLHTAACKTPC